MSAPRYFDVSVPLETGMPAYPGNPDFELHAVKRIAEGGSSNVSRLVLGTHTGTHVDAPRHFFDDGAAVDALPLDVLVGPARVVSTTHGGGITVEDLAAMAGAVRVLLKTPNSGLWNSRGFHRDYAYLTEAAARHLVERGTRLVGIDYLSIEEFKKAGAPAHRVLLSAGTTIVEGLNLAAVEPGEYEMFCLPLRVAGGDGAPARVVLRR